MDILNLADSPRFIMQTLKLIEESFEYPDDQQFDTDFYPLFNKNNFENCFIIIEDNKVLAHIGVKLRKLIINKQTHLIAMYGGIAVDENQRGRGLFSKLFEHVLELNKNVALHLLWSEKLELYKKFQFYPAIDLYQYPLKKDEALLQSNLVIEKKILGELSNRENDAVKDLYNSTLSPHLGRDGQDWEEIKNITSTEFYLIKKDKSVVNYFFKGKGADLNNIIHEYGVIDKEYLNILRNYAEVWTPFKVPELAPNTLFATVLAYGQKQLFTELVRNYTGILIKQITKDLVVFLFEGSEITLPIGEFLQGVFGPGRFKELTKTSPIFISGLDSI
jgi:GNAT superfamily N-acetyltransferase